SMTSPEVDAHKTSTFASSSVILPPSSSAASTPMTSAWFKPTPAPAAATTAAAAAKVTPPKGPVVINGVEFAASAEEARKRVGKKREKLKKASSMSMKDKYELFQKL